MHCIHRAERGHRIQLDALWWGSGQYPTLFCSHYRCKPVMNLCNSLKEKLYCSCQESTSCGLFTNTNYRKIIMSTGEAPQFIHCLKKETRQTTFIVLDPPEKQKTWTYFGPKMQVSKLLEDICSQRHRKDLKSTKMVWNWLFIAVLSLNFCLTRIVFVYTLISLFGAYLEHKIWAFSIVTV